MKLLALGFLLGPALSAQAPTQPPPAPAAQLALCNQLRSLTQDPSVASAHWGLQLTDLQGTPVCSINEAQLFRPASNNKIFTTATALALLGPTHTIETKVLGNLDPATGTVTGPLTLLGGGDANLDSHDLPYLTPAERTKLTPPVSDPPFFADLEDLATQLVDHGVKSITGEIVGDDTLFPYEPYPISWSADDLVWGYGAPVSALTIADNQLRLTITPATAGQPATVTLDQHGVDYYTVINHVDTFPAKHPQTAIQVERLPGSRTVRVYGSIAADARPDTEEIAIDDPALYAAMAFRKVLLAHGIAISGSARSQHLPSEEHSGFVSSLRAADPYPDLTRGGDCMQPRYPAPLATHRSASLLQDVILTSKVSQNLHAELLLHQLGLQIFCGRGSTLQGAKMIRNYLLKAGLAPNDFLFYDGSGLSDHDLVAPRATAKFLAYSATQPWFPQFKTSLPEAGVDGTLTTRFKTLPPGRLFAKTGTLGESRALSGYLTATSGRQLIFSLMVDTHLPTTAGPPPDRTIMDRIIETIAAQ